MNGISINLSRLDALRGFLAVYVLAGHSRWLLWEGHAKWLTQSHPAWETAIAYSSALLRFGHEAVMIFFALSGFFIHLRLAKGFSHGTPELPNVRDFYQRRLHRLFVPYLFALLVTIVCDTVGASCFPRLYKAASGDPQIDDSFSRKGYGAQSVIPAMLLLPSSLGQDFGTNGPLWSLAYEVVYYALYPAWCLLRMRSPWLAYAVAPVASIAIALSLLDSVSLGPQFLASVLIHYPVWLAGAGLAEWLLQRPPSNRSKWCARSALLAGTALLVAKLSLLCAVVVSALYGCAVVYLIAATAETSRKSRLSHICEYFGVRSYTIYICHFPILALLCAALIQKDGTRPAHGWFALAGFAMSLAVSSLCFEVCEKRFLHSRISAIVGREQGQ